MGLFSGFGHSGSDGEVVFSITADNKDAVDAIHETVKEMKSAGSDLADAADKADQNISKSFTHAFNVERIKNWAIQAGKWLVQFGKEAISAASDLQEVQNVVDTTFGDSASVIDSWAKTASRNFGLTETQAKRFTSTLGAMAKSSGLAGDDIVKMSTDLAGLAADMASFYNLDFDTAFQKIRSGIAGETEPLKQLGINMSVANLEAYALTQGITKAFNKMSQGEQIMLRYQYMMQATADAQGDFARTSNEYANSVRILQNNLESIRTRLGEILIPKIEEFTADINGFLEKLAEKPKLTLFEELEQIDLDLSKQYAEIDSVYGLATSLNEVLKEVAGNLVLKRNKPEGEETDEEAEELFTEEVMALLALGNKSDEAKRKLQELGFSTRDIEVAQTEWLDICNRLVQTIPSLSNVIDVNTGEIKGGTGAVQDYINAWKDLEDNKALISALEKKKQALIENTRVTDYEVEKILARKNLEKARARYNDDKMYPRDPVTTYKITEELRKAESEYEKASANYDLAVKQYQEGMAILLEVESELENKNKDLGESFEDAADGMTVFERAAYGEEDAIEVVKGAVKEALEALQALDDYQQTVRNDVDRSVRQTINGFNEIVTPANKAKQELYDARKALAKLSEQDKKSADGKALQNSIVSLQGSIPSAQNMRKGLQSQIQYMKEYNFLMEQAKSMGLSDELLSQFSDGSVESYDYLAAIVASSEQEVKELNETWKEFNTERESFTDSLTQTRLEADDQFAQLVQDAQDAVEGLNLEQEAYDSVAALVTGIVVALKDKRTEVATEVDAILQIMGRLASVNFGVSVSHGGFVSGLVGSLFTPHADGLDYVPYNGYLASLHEGESILTAEEAKVWRGFKNGGQDSRNSIDYGRLSSAIWDNAPSMGGGNVYLDGQTVGRVISAQQANAYRSLQRSGWSA